MLSVATSPGAEIVEKLKSIKLLESDYLLQNDPRLLEQIFVLCGDIRDQLIPKEGGIDLADLDSYMTLTGNLVSLENRIGTAVSGGIFSNLSGSVNNLSILFDDIRRHIHEADSAMRLWCHILQFLVIFLILTACILLFNRISGNFVFNPLGQLEGLTVKIAAGDLPAVTMNPGNLPVISSITKSLEKLVTGLREKITFTGALNEGKMDSNLALAGEHDQLGNELIKLQQKILEASRQQRKNEEDNFRRRYINEGLAKFGDILRSKSNELDALGDAFIREIVKYLGAVQGGFFAFDNADGASPVLRLVSAFAYNRKKYLQKSVTFGEGLVGTCAREKQTINLTELPADYISITSGLGETLPDNLLLVPVLHENELIGVLEIASLLKYKDHEIKFAEEVARSLGSTIIYARNNQRTADLLAKSQQQALEMSEQEEEMRQNMEELKATQEESERREEEFRGIAQAIEHALFVIEYDLDGKIRKVNDRFCIFIGRSSEEIIGHQHHEIFDSNIKPDRHFWDDIIKNQRVTLTEQVKIGKKTFRLLEHFTTVQNNDNLTVKFINFVTDDRTGNS
jgi:PAS domain S-box-containing protein